MPFINVEVISNGPEYVFVKFKQFIHNLYKGLRK